jgi:hypothetical protein
MFSSGFAENVGFSDPERSVLNVREHRKHEEPAFAGQHELNLETT